MSEEPELRGLRAKTSLIDEFIEEDDPREYITIIVKDSKLEFKELLKENVPKLPDNRLQKLTFIMGRASGKLFMQRRTMLQALYPEVFRIQNPIDYLFHGKEKFINV